MKRTVSIILTSAVLAAALSGCSNPLQREVDDLKEQVARIESMLLDMQTKEEAGKTETEQGTEVESE